MRTMFSALVAVAIPTMTVFQFAAAQNLPQPVQGPVHVVTYIEVAAEARDRAAALLRELRGAGRDPDLLRSDVLQEIHRPGRFAIVDVWERSAFESRELARAAQLSANLGALQLAPPDRRIHDAYSVAPQLGDGELYLLTHVDVPSPNLAALEPLLPELTQASRKEGAIAFDVLQQTSRKNHFTVVELWKDENAFNAHSAAPAARSFRERLGPLLGALYDQRLYRRLK